jgi:hypothetical protein
MSTAVTSTTLVMALVANGSSREILVCRSGDATTFNNNQVGETTKVTPSVATVESRLCLGLRSNNDKNDLLVCSSPDGTSWTANIKTKQTSRYAPCLFGMVAVRGRGPGAFARCTRAMSIRCPPPWADAQRAGSGVDHGVSRKSWVSAPRGSGAFGAR